MDLRRKSPVPLGTSTDTSPPRLLRNNLDLPVSPSSAGIPLQPPLAAALAPGLPLPSLSKISNISSTSTNATLSEEYSAEADLVRRQTGMLVHLMQAAASAATAASAAEAAAAVAAAAPDSRSNSGSAGSGSRAPVAGALLTGGMGGGPGVFSRAASRRSLAGVSAAAVLRRYSSNGSGRAPLGPDVLEAARQLLCIQVCVGGGV